MPTYTLKNIKTNDRWDTICSWNQLQEMLEHDPEIIQVPSAPKFVSAAKDMYGQTPDGFKDLNELAIGSGFGMRYNLGYFILRLDTGFKTYNPVLENKDRWFTDFNMKNAVFNIGLNYPF